MNGRFPIALHIMTLLCSAEGGVLSSEYMAGSINVNAVLVRKELSNLIKHKLVSSQAGKNGGYTLARSAAQITLAQIYETVKPEAVLGQAKNQPNPACPIGKQINQHISDLYIDIDRALMQKLGDTDLKAFVAKFD
ncbi:Rrf2 family transcriptional regulator [Mucilaginibacter psychrotolerans]|uniref:Transcriptional regulator n=1 Tax=Mucilaginibacter psychrotolerans TaxID=1524096 RepID=A0A4Y8S3N0_9SPHI|nr:Rrf2 family transcriptional regulator [Mucilaginibacter psychrotolerans]TFF33265.1 transcriptional regulator [Mucilaginibacter psychrotolerans]